MLSKSQGYQLGRVVPRAQDAKGLKKIITASLCSQQKLDFISFTSVLAYIAAVNAFCNPTSLLVAVQVSLAGAWAYLPLPANT